MQFVRETQHVYVQVLKFPNSSVRKRFIQETVTVTAFVRRNPCSHGRFLISSPIATPTPLRLLPRQTSQPTFHFVLPKTFSRNKTHLKHHSVPLNRFIRNEIPNLLICVTTPRHRPSFTAATTDGVTQLIIVQRLAKHPHTTSHSVPPKTFSQNKTHLKHHSVPLNRFIWDKTLRPAFFRAKRTWSCYRTDTHKL